ncbi:hypothetical protein [Streptomyces sp. NPDC102437]|uniref:hypothetical protein n=1 Tax=Streptomyces sp. NPDC102437 TaxID=3366175 RepID=UPI00380DBB68
MNELDDTDRMDRAEKGTVRGALHAVLKDLFTPAPQPMPPMGGPRPLRWLPHFAVAAAASGLRRSPVTMSAFFDKQLRSEDAPLLDGQGKDNPEVPFQHSATRNVEVGSGTSSRT